MTQLESSGKAIAFKMLVSVSCLSVEVTGKSTIVQSINFALLKI